MKAWLQLFRVPNLFTVPGDPLAAFLIATGGVLDARVIPAIIASLCLYAAGLAMNDLADYQEDLRDRPNRPLPSGRVSRAAAWAVVLLLSVNALGLLYGLSGPFAALVGAGLLAHIAAYNFLTKRITFIGAVNMGLCRALSAALGAVVGFSPTANATALTAFMTAHPMLGLWLSDRAQNFAVESVQAAIICGGLIGLYIAAVTNLARHETQAAYPRLPRLLPVGALLIGYVLLKQYTGPILLDQSPTLWLFGIVLCTMNASELMKDPPPPLAPRIGGFIRLLPIFQAALCVLSSVPTPLRKTPASLICAGALLLCVPIHYWLGKKFYAS